MERMQYLLIFSVTEIIIFSSCYWVELNAIVICSIGMIL